MLNGYLHYIMHWCIFCCTNDQDELCNVRFILVVSNANIHLIKNIAIIPCILCFYHFGYPNASAVFTDINP